MSDPPDDLYAAGWVAGFAEALTSVNGFCLPCGMRGAHAFWSWMWSDDPEPVALACPHSDSPEFVIEDGIADAYDVRS